MEQALKQRLVGALVITALAAIFVPMFFEDSGDESREVDQSDLAIPAAPEQNFSEDNPIPKSPQQVLHAPEDDTAAISATETPEEGSESPSDELGEQAVQEEDTQPEQPIEQAEETAEPEEEQPADSLAPPPAPIAAEKPKTETSAPLTLQQPPPAKKVKPQPQPAAMQPLQERQQPVVQLKQPSATAVPPAKAQALKRWVVQLGSFSKKDNADVLVNKLRTQGFNAYGDSIQVAGKGTMYRVRIGPELDKKRAQATQKKLQQVNGSSSILLAE